MKLENYFTILLVHVFLSFSFCAHAGQSSNSDRILVEPATGPLTAEQPTTCSSERLKSCAEIQNSGSKFNSFQNCLIYPFGPERESLEALCDFETDDGGWTIIQKRSSGPKEQFYRNWTDYEEGFGSIDGNFWIGLKAIHALTKEQDQELRIDLWDFEGGQAYAQFSKFSISDSSDFYRLSIEGYSGTAGDSMNYHNGMRFSTKDEDHDNWGRNCAESRRGAWWYSSCAKSNLNGFYYDKGESQDPIYSGVLWDTWKNDYRSLRQVEMKIRSGTTSTTETTTEPTTEQPTTCSSGRPKSCAEIQSEGLGFNSSRTCMIYPFGPEEDSIEVFCDFKTDGGGWTTIQKRSSGPKEEFFRGWVEYENGFGSADGSYWLGLKAIHALTKDRDQELRVDLWDFEGDQAYAKYSSFFVADTLDYYRLLISGYSGTAGDSMTPDWPMGNLNQMGFSTKDNDHDNSVDNCAEQYRGAWWYNSCFYSNLNGFYYPNGETIIPDGSGIEWFHWKNSSRSLQKVEMKVRRRV